MIGIKLLGFREKDVWKMTFRKLVELNKAYSRLSGEKEDKEEQNGIKKLPKGVR